MTYNDYKGLRVVEAAEMILDFMRKNELDCGLQVGERTDLWYFLRSIQNHIKSNVEND